MRINSTDTWTGGKLNLCCYCEEGAQERWAALPGQGVTQLALLLLGPLDSEVFE